MHIFLGGLRTNATRDDVADLVRRTLRGPWYRLFSPRAELADCELYQLIELKTGNAEHCAVLRIEPGRLSWELVEALQGAVYQGRQLRSHRWLPRNGAADRRFGELSITRPAAQGERRAVSDRRGQMKLRKLGVGLEVRAVSGFERSHGA